MTLYQHIPLPQQQSEFTLIEEGLPQLLPPMVRGAGIHVSEVINSLCVKLGHYDESTELPLTRVQLGQAFEYWVINNLQSRYPNRYTHIGELKLDDISGNSDLYDMILNGIVEIKLTWMSSKNDPSTVKFWKYITQLKSYCKMAGVTVGVLMVGFMCDRTGSGDVPFRVWQADFSRQALDENWTIIRNEARRMENAR